MLIWHICPPMRMIFLFKQSMKWILAGKQTHASSKSTIQATNPIATRLLSLPKLRPRLTLIKRIKCSRMPQTSLKLGRRQKNTKKSTQMLNPFQIVNYQQTLTGETSRESISQASIEIKATVVPATLFLSLRLPRWDWSSSMERICQSSLLNSSWPATIWMRDAMVDGLSSMDSWLKTVT